MFDATYLSLGSESFTSSLSFLTYDLSTIEPLKPLWISAWQVDRLSP